MNNRIHNCKNLYQGTYKKVLCVCSAGLLRSPTAAFVLSQAPFNYNTRTAGIDEDYALIPVDYALVFWADEIVCMDKRQVNMLEKIRANINDGIERPIICLDIKDSYAYRDPHLIELIEQRYKERTAWTVT